MVSLSRIALFLVLGLVSSPLSASERKPNVVLIFTDDQGSVDAGCYGASDLKTPAIDRLAARGIRFTQFYAAAPVCSPSRAGLLTGRYPLRAGMPGNTSSQQGHAGMPPGQVTIAEMLRSAGYATAHVGKWHLGYTPETMPRGQGFDHSFGHMGGCIDNYSHFFYWAGPNRHDLWRNGEEVYHDGEFFPDLMVREAKSFMEKNVARPFFIYFALNTPHYPYQGSPKWLEQYEGTPYPRNLYNAFVSTMDERIGALLAAIDELELADRTIVIFQSDHGHSVEMRAHNGGGSNGPYRGHKFTMFEGGLRVPAIISWPGELPRDQTRGQVAHSCDWLPTIAELCDVPLLEKDVDGKSLVPVLRSRTAPSPHEVLHWQTGRGNRAQWCVRRGPWKLIGNARTPAEGPELTPADRKLFLSNLERDIAESHNLASDHPHVVQELQALRDRWLQAQEATTGS